MNTLVTLFKTIETFAFRVPRSALNNRSNDRALNELILHPTISLPFLKKEFKNSLIFSGTLFVIFMYLLITNYNQIFNQNSDYFLSKWFLAINFLNIFGFFPKVLSLYKLNKFNINDERIILSRLLWLFLRCKIYTININLSKIIFAGYVLGIFRIWQIGFEKENFLVNVSYLFIFIFFLRLFLSFLRFSLNFSTINLSKTMGLTQNELDSLKITKLNQNDINNLEKNDQNICSICCDFFLAGQQVRTMKCPGSHFFHLKCIDKWLAFRKTCPNCNIFAFGKICL